MGLFRGLGLGLIASTAFGCGGSVSTDTSHAAGSGGMTPSTGGSGGSATGGSTSTSGLCGGGLKGCSADQYCDFGGTDCGAQGEHGVCKPRPADCAVCDCAAVLCGCDGKVYGTACEAYAAGVDISSTQSCIPKPSSCDALASSLATQFQNFACTTTLKLDPQSGLTIGGYSISCGTWVSAVDEATARATAQADTGFGGECGSQILQNSGPPDQIVIFHPMSFTKCACCGNGWVAAVSATTGLSALGVGLPLSGPSGITFPKAWQSASDLGFGCNTPLPSAPMHGWDLGNPFLGTSATELDADSVSAALGAVYSTALPSAIQQAGQYVSSAVVLRYPLSLGDDFVQNQVIVLLNSEHPLD